MQPVYRNIIHHASKNEEYIQILPEVMKESFWRIIWIFEINLKLWQGIDEKKLRRIFFSDTTPKKVFKSG